MGFQAFNLSDWSGRVTISKNKSKDKDVRGAGLGKTSRAELENIMFEIFIKQLGRNA